MQRLFRFIGHLNKPWFNVLVKNWKPLTISIAGLGVVIAQGIWYMLSYPTTPSICTKCGGDHAAINRYLIGYIGLPLTEIALLAALVLGCFLLYLLFCITKKYIKKCWREAKE